MQDVPVDRELPALRRRPEHRAYLLHSGRQQGLAGRVDTRAAGARHDRTAVAGTAV